MFRPKSEPIENIKYIFCAPSSKLTITDNKYAVDKVLMLSELENAILTGNEKRLAMFSPELQTIEDAEWFGRELSEISTKEKDNFWVLKLQISPIEYGEHKKKFDLLSSIGDFLYPLKDQIIKCVNPNGVSITFEAPQPTPSGWWCSIM